MEYIQLTAVVTPVQPGSDILLAELSDLGFESFEETGDGLKAWIQFPLFSEDALHQLDIFRNPDFAITYSLEKIGEQNWNEEWEKNFDPIEINDQAVIKAEFHKLDRQYAHEFLITPKMAFGTGHHETTWMMANALFHLDLKGKTVLDMGCGTGILAVIAEKLGAEKLVAIDIEAPAVDNTLEHLQLNHCSHCTVHLGGAELLGDQYFDVIFANINRNVLTRDMHAYAAVLRPGGEILFSGFFGTDVELITATATNSGLSFVSVATKNNWAQVTCRKPA